MLLILVITLFITYLIWRQADKCSRLPPGPLAIPIIGNLPQLAIDMFRYGGVAAMLSAYRKKYGNVFTIWLGPIPTVNIGDYEIAHEVMVKNANKYADKYQSEFLQLMRDGRGIVATNGEKWHEQRRFALHTLRNMGMGREIMEERILAELNDRCNDIDSKAVNGITVIKSAEFFELTVGSVINSILLGFRFNKNPQDYWDLKRKIEKFQSSASPILMFLPAPKIFARRKMIGIQSIIQDVKDFVGKDAVRRWEEMKEGKYTVTDETARDFVDFYLLKIKKDEEDGVQSTFEIEELKIVLIDLWLAGQETTTTTLNSGFNQLLHHPEVMDKARTEIRDITNNGSRHLSLKDRLKTPYLNAVINEIQRHASILNTNFFRINHEPTIMGGHPVDGNTLVTVQMSVIHRNDTMFENYKSFDPERFIRDSSLGNQVIPFGVGKRACVGESLARAELYLIIGNLLLNYEFKPHGELKTCNELYPYNILRKFEKQDIQFIKI